jgi:Transglycosylase SLT domain
MRALIIILTVMLSCPYVAQAAATGASTDGSLVLGGQDGKLSRASKESLSVLLNKEVEVFIFRHQTRIWPRPAASSGPKVCRPEVESLINKYSSLHQVDPSLVRAVMRHESGFNPQAVSPKGAQGLMQLMPGTADLMGVSNPFDPEQNIAGGVGYLRHCLNRFNNDPVLAVAAYNAGPERVAKTGGIPAIPETQTYVRNVMETYTGKAQPATPTKGAHFVTPASGKNSKTIKGASPTTLAKADSKEKDKPKRRGPKIIEVRYPSKKSN